MVAFARRYVGDGAVAEDVVEDLVERWLKQPPQFQDGERVTAFLAVSIYHSAIDWIRRERAEQGIAPRGEPALVVPGQRRKVVIGTPRSNDSRETLQLRLTAALERVSSSDRLLLETHYGHALTADECMALLGISRAAFHQRLHRARARLLQFLEAE